MSKAILTVTLNPSVDIAYPLEHLRIDDINRIQTVSKTAGGKGLNVARVIHQMNTNVTTTGFLGGNLGQYISQQLKKEGINEQFLHIDQESRNCIAILHDNGKQTEILESGPIISENDEFKFLQYFDELLNNISIVTISGSLPAGLKSDYYSRLIELAQKKQIPVLLDSSGVTLEMSLNQANKPYLIKPNQKEIAQLTHQPISNIQQLKNILQTNILFKDIDWVVVSLGAMGALAKVKTDIFEVKIPKIKVVNPVGSGDSTVAGLAVALSKELSPQDTLKTAMTCGMLNTMENKTGYINNQKFQEFFDKVKVQKIN